MALFSEDNETRPLVDAHSVLSNDIYRRLASENTISLWTAQHGVLVLGSSNLASHDG